MIGASLTIEDRIFKGWTAVQATYAIDAVAGEFSVSAEQVGDVLIYPDETAVLKLENQTVCSGYITETNASFGAQASGLSLRGADKTLDLVHCSAVHEPDEWFNLNLTEIASKLCNPFSLKVIPQISDVGDVFKSFKIQPGESVFDALDRAAKARAVLVSSDCSGNLLLTRAGANGIVEDLVYGENILDAELSLCSENRFSKYIVKNQTVMIDDTQESINTAGYSQDLNVNRYRPLLLVVQNAENGGTVNDLAAWEATVRAGLAATVTLTVEGWTQSNGILWQKNALSRVYIPRWKIDANLLVKQVSFSLDKNGAKTKLSVVSSEAYKRLPVVAKSKDAGGLLPPDAIEIK